MSTKEFKKCYFVIYDLNDNIICYLDNYREIYRYTDLRISDIAKRYNNGYLLNIGRKFYILKAFREVI